MNTNDRTLTTDALITVIIPVGPRHTRLVLDAIDSVEKQTYRGWHILIANDSGQPIDTRHEQVDTGGGKWTSIARNMAIKRTRTPFVAFLDADDAYTDGALELMIRAFAKANMAYIYGGHWNTGGPEGVNYYAPPSYSRNLLLLRHIHSIATLIPTLVVRKVGGFNETMKGWEDWEFFIRMGAMGFCGEPVPYPLITYRTNLGSNRTGSLEQDGLFPAIKEAYQTKLSGDNVMPCSGCGDPQALSLALDALKNMPPEMLTADGKVMMEYIGQYEAPVSYTINNNQYRAGLNDRWIVAPIADVPALEALGVFRRAVAPAKALQPYNFRAVSIPTLAPFVPMTDSLTPTEAGEAVTYTPSFGGLDPRDHDHNPKVSPTPKKRKR